ncbi:MAG: ABC transporter ATP-binding protein, partial [Haloglomus sp.]
EEDPDADDLAVDEGEVYALVGPNGSGKTTALNVLLGLVRPTAGDARICGEDTWDAARAARQHLGVVPEGYGVYGRLTGRRHVAFAATSRGWSGDPDAVLERVGLQDVADRRAGTYSRGMKKRLVLAMALVGDPDVLLLDEPFNGLDPDAAQTLRTAIEHERERGTSVLLASHLFREVAAVADRVGMLSGGELVREGPVADVVEGRPTIDSLEAAYREAVTPEVPA